MASGAIVERLEEDLMVPPCTSYDTTVQNVTYVSDVEGQWDYFCNFVEHSKGLNFSQQTDAHLRREPDNFDLELEEGWHFVYGGDACDKGNGTLRFLETINLLKEKYPDRVHLLLGNGDINRLRWRDGLMDEVMRAPKGVTVSLWAAGGPYQFEQEDMDNRREELAHLGGKFTHEVTDKDVMKSYMEGLKPGGHMREYLQKAQLSVMLGETLFVDGQVIAMTPAEEAEPLSDEEKEQQGQELEDWVTRLNVWSRSRLSDLDSKPPWEKLPDQIPKRKQAQAEQDQDQDEQEGDGEGAEGA